MEEANVEMPTYITFGSTTGNIFQNLEKIINLVSLFAYLSILFQFLSINFFLLE